MAPRHGDGKSKEEWINIFRKFASKEFNFGRGQNPRPGTWAAGELGRINACPLSTGATTDLTGKLTECTCSYHKGPNAQVASTSSLTPSTTPTPIGATSGPEDIRDRMPKGWRETIDELDQEWIAKSLFTNNKKLVLHLQLWWFPPQPQHTGYPQPQHYFNKPLFLWAPYRMWRTLFKCPRCPKSLTSKGLYNRVRTVLDVKGSYYLACEYLECSECSGTFQTWDNRLISQLADHVAARFPCLLTYKFACDKSVIIMMRSRHIGNSAASIMKMIEENHTESYLKLQLQYMGDYKSYQKGLSEMKIASKTCIPPPPMMMLASKKYTSRYKLMLNDYEAIRHRVMNTITLLGKFSLINVNLRTVQLWFKDKSREEEIATLISSQHLPALERPCSSSSALPPPRPKPTEACATTPVVFEEPVDTTGDAKPRSTSTGSRTTQWRMKKALQAAAAGDEASQKKVRKYTCPGCGGLATDPGHTQYRGKRFCPKTNPSIAQEDWIKEQKQLFEARKMEKKQMSALRTVTSPVVQAPTSAKPAPAEEFSGFQFNTQDVLDSINTQELIETFGENSINPMDF